MTFWPTTRIQSHIGWRKVKIHRDMNNCLKYLAIVFVMGFLCVSLTPISHSAFYKYVDENGRVFYVDDLGKVPEAYRDQIKVYQEKYDDLPEQDRSEALKKEREQIQQQEQLNQLRLSEQLEEARAQEAEEKKRKAARARRQMMENMERLNFFH